MPLKSMVRCHSIKCHWILNHMHSIGRLWVLVGRILYHFSDKVTYWWKISIFQCPWRSWRYRDLNTVITFGKEKLEWWAYHVVKSLMTCLAVSVQYRCMTVTDIHNTQTDGHLATAESKICRSGFVYSADADTDADGGRRLCVFGGLCVDM